MNPIGITSWIWTSPLTTDRFPEIAQHVARLGFDLLEVPIEGTGDLDYTKAAGVIKDLGLSTSVCAAMSPDRDLIHADASVRANAMAYVKHCIDAAQTIGATNVVGPLYSAVGRTWQATADERKKDLDLLVGELKDLARYAGERGVVICVEPLNRFETSFLNLTSQAIEVVDRVDHPACGLLLDTFHMNIEEQSIGAAIRSAGAAAEAPARVRERPRRAGLGTHRVGRSRRRVPRHQLSGPRGDRVVHPGREVDRARRRHLAPAGPNPGRPGAGRAQTPPQGVWVGRSALSNAARSG